MSLLIKRTDFYSFAFVVISVAMLLWQHFGMNKTLALTPAQNFGATVESDRQEGGDSQPRLKIGDFFDFSCEIQTNSEFTHPYCNLIFSLKGDTAKDSESGVDLSAYDSLRITLNHKSSFDEDVRLYLNHFYQEQTSSLFPFKMNLFTLKTNKGKQTYTIDLDDFYVPAWWVCNSQIDNPDVMLSNVRHVMVTTGDAVQGRITEIEVHKLVFSGKWLQKNTLYQFLLFFWLVYVGLIVFVRFIRLQQKANILKSRSKQLEKLNTKLDGQSQLYQKLATIDELTGIPNRLGMKNKLSALSKKHSKNKPTFSMLLIDIDYFKTVNDQHGHDIGDQVLRQFATLLNTHIRKTDFVCRWGGEEFMVICIDTELDSAATVAENIREMIESSDFNIDKAITCSIGVAEAYSEFIEDTFRSADKALYEAKNLGRNKVVKAKLPSQ